MIDNNKLDFKKYVILVADDNTANIKTISTYLEEIGFRILIARNGESSVIRAKHAKPDIILLDIMMPPGINGFETCRQLKADERTKDIPVIFMTALHDTKHKIQGFEVGGVDYVTKPVNHTELLARITTHLRIKEQHHTLLKMTTELQQANTQVLQLNQKLEDKVRDRTLQLELATKMAETANKAKSTFIANISHELRTPLNVIIGFIQVMMDKQNVLPEYEENLKIMYHSSNHLLSIINKMIEISRIEDTNIAIDTIDTVLKDLQEKGMDEETKKLEDVDIEKLKEKAATLSPTLIVNLKTAIEQADIDEIYTLIEQINLQEPTLADILNKLVANFDYKKIELIIFNPNN